MNNRLLFIVALVVAIVLLTACGNDSSYSEDSEGVRRYGVVDNTEYGGGSVGPGMASAAPVKPAAGATKPVRPSTSPKKPGPSRKPSRGKYKEIEVANGGTIKGVCKFDKAPTPLKPVPVSKDVAPCKHEQHPSERMVFDAGKLTVKNCFVFLRDIGEGKKWTGEMAKSERSAMLDQVECMYVPHILPVRDKTQLNVKNSDAVVHNIHGYRETLQTTQFNFFTQANSVEMDTGDAYLKKAAKYIMGCDVHPWMNAYVMVIKHPYFFVTDMDGAYTLDDVPPGDYEIVCWHEGMQEVPQMKAGEISGYDYGPDIEVVKKVTVSAGGTSEVDFAIPAP